VSIKRGFDGGWDATVLQGERMGQAIKSKVENLTLRQWTAADTVHRYGVDFGSATQEQRKQATF